MFPNLSYLRSTRRTAEDAGGRSSVRGTSENIARAWSCDCNGRLRVCRGVSVGGEAPGGAELESPRQWSVGHARCRGQTADESPSPRMRLVVGVE